MTTFKSFRNRTDKDPPSGDGSAAVPGAPSSATELGPQHLDILREIEDEGEPLSLAEELAELADRGELAEVNEKLAKLNKQHETHIAELQKMSMAQLIEEARKENVKEVAGLKRQDLIFRILKERVKMNGLMYGEGTLEILPDGFGFLRSPDYHYLSCPGRHLRLAQPDSPLRPANGRDRFSGQIRPAEGERALLRPAAGRSDQLSRSRTWPPSRVSFDDLTPLHPDKRIVMEHDPEDACTRVVDLVTPIGFGQRGLIVSPPRAGKTILMQKMAKAVLKNFPEAYVIMLLVDERPEEVTDMERQVKGRNCEVISSARSTNRRPATCRSPTWCWKRPSGWSSAAPTW